MPSRLIHYGYSQQRIHAIVLHMQCHFLSVLIRIHVIHPNTTVIVQLMNIVSNLIFHCIAMQIQHSSQFMIARQPRQVSLVVHLMQNLRLRGRPPPIIFTRIVRPMNALQLCRWQFSHRCYGGGTTSENRAQSAMSLKRGHFDPKFQVQVVAPTNHFCTVS